MNQIDVNVDFIYENIKNKKSYKPLYTKFANNEEKMVYIDQEGKVWCKSKERFMKGMEFKKVACDNEDFLFDLNDVPEAFYVNNKPLLNKKMNKKGVINCFANANADENKKDEYPLMVVINIENESYLYTFKEFEEYFLKS